jgi:hypothetical protein
MAKAYLITLHAIECKKLNEDGDEIYYLVNGVAQRPSGDPDYWAFEKVGEKKYPNRNVLEGPEGSEVTVAVNEQDGGLRFDDDKMGVVVLKVANGSVEFVEKKGTTYVGKRKGYHVVDFHDSDGVYALHFAARTVESI